MYIGRAGVCRTSFLVGQVVTIWTFAVEDDRFLMHLYFMKVGFVEL